MTASGASGTWSQPEGAAEVATDLRGVTAARVKAAPLREECRRFVRYGGVRRSP